MYLCSFCGVPPLQSLFSVFSRSTHTLVVMAVSAESELLKAAAIIPIVKSINTGFPKYPLCGKHGKNVVVHCRKFQLHLSG